LLDLLALLETLGLLQSLLIIDDNENGALKREVRLEKIGGGSGVRLRPKRKLPRSIGWTWKAWSTGIQ